jgi:hypothetical protein
VVLHTFVFDGKTDQGIADTSTGYYLSVERGFMKETFLIIGGAICIVWVIFHLLLWKIFDWKNSLNSLSHQQRSIMYTANIMMIYVLIVFVYLSMFQRTTLISSSLGRGVLVVIAFFFLVRAILQVVFGFRQKESIRRSIVIIVACAVTALLYLVPFWI